MISQSVIRLVLQNLEYPHSIAFGHNDVVQWPTGVLAALTDAGVVRESGHVTSVICRECSERCSVEVHVVAVNDGKGVRAFTECAERDDIPRVWIDEENLRTWKPNARALAEWVAKGLGATGAIEEVIADRLWWLGGPMTKGRRIDVFLAIGATWPDARAIFAHVGRLNECSSPMVIVPNAVPTDNPLGAAVRIQSLARLLSLHDGALSLDAAELVLSVRSKRARRTQDVRTFDTPPGTRWDQVAIELVADIMVRITAGNRQESHTYEDLGFVDRRTQAEHPDYLWKRFMWLAENSGCPDWDDIHSCGISVDLLKKQISDIRKRLTAYFGINDDPFERYRSDRPYKTKFALEDRRRHRG